MRPHHGFDWCSSDGDRYRSRFAWTWLIAGILVWAPQDIAISLRANAWVHVWIDCIALLTMLPPLLGLWLFDANKKSLKGN